MGIENFKVGGIYMLLYDEDLYTFIDKNKDLYSEKELGSAGHSERAEMGTILMFVKMVTEISNWATKNQKIPVFFYKERLVIPYSTCKDMLSNVKEVIDENP